MMQLVKIDSPWHQEFHHVAPSSKEWNNKSAQSQLSTKPPRSRAKTSTSVVSGWRGEDTGCWPPKTRGPNNGSWLSRRKTGTNRRTQQTCLHYSVGKVLPSPFHSQVKYNTHTHIYIYSYLNIRIIYIHSTLHIPSCLTKLHIHLPKTRPIVTISAKLRHIAQHQALDAVPDERKIGSWETAPQTCNTDRPKVWSFVSFQSSWIWHSQSWVVNYYGYLAFVYLCEETKRDRQRIQHIKEKTCR